jgi:hypothetical protein
VSRFRITGIEPGLDPAQPDAFPVKLRFSTPTASFVMRALTKDQVPGDCNQDGAVDISDAICIFLALFVGPPHRLPCEEGAADAEGNVTLLAWQGGAAVNISDGIALLQRLFGDGPPHILGGDCVAIPECPVGPESPCSGEAGGH